MEHGMIESAIVDYRWTSRRGVFLNIVLCNRRHKYRVIGQENMLRFRLRCYLWCTADDEYWNRTHTNICNICPCLARIEKKLLGGFIEIFAIMLSPCVQIKLFYFAITPLTPPTLQFNLRPETLFQFLILNTIYCDQFIMTHGSELWSTYQWVDKYYQHPITNEKDDMVTDLYPVTLAMLISNNYCPLTLAYK